MPLVLHDHHSCTNITGACCQLPHVLREWETGAHGQSFWLEARTPGWQGPPHSRKTHAHPHGAPKTQCSSLGFKTYTKTLPPSLATIAGWNIPATVTANTCMGTLYPVESLLLQETTLTSAKTCPQVVQHANCPADSRLELKVQNPCPCLIQRKPQSHPLLRYKA